MSRRRRVKHELEDEGADSGELNLVPYLDIITTLVIFLIFTFQVVIEFRLIELLPPPYGQAANPNPDPAEKKTTLTLLVLDSGYRLVTDQVELGTAEVPLKADGTYDNAKLTEVLATTKKNLGLDESLILIADAQTEYKIVVAAMDAARQQDGKLLFPDILLAEADAGGAP